MKTFASLQRDSVPSGLPIYIDKYLDAKIAGDKKCVEKFCELMKQVPVNSKWFIENIECFIGECKDTEFYFPDAVRKNSYYLSLSLQLKECFNRISKLEIKEYVDKRKQLVQDEKKLFDQISILLKQTRNNTFLFAGFCIAAIISFLVFWDDQVEGNDKYFSNRAIFAGSFFMAGLAGVVKFGKDVFDSSRMHLIQVPLDRHRVLLQKNEKKLVQRVELLNDSGFAESLNKLMLTLNTEETIAGNALFNPAIKL